MACFEFSRNVDEQYYYMLFRLTLAVTVNTMGNMALSAVNASLISYLLRGQLR